MSDLVAIAPSHMPGVDMARPYEEAVLLSLNPECLERVCLHPFQGVCLATEFDIDTSVCPIETQ